MPRLTQRPLFAIPLMLAISLFWPLAAGFGTVQLPSSCSTQLRHLLASLCFSSLDSVAALDFLPSMVS